LTLGAAVGSMLLAQAIVGPPEADANSCRDNRDCHRDFFCHRHGSCHPR